MEEFFMTFKKGFSLSLSLFLPLSGFGTWNRKTNFFFMYRDQGRLSP